MNTRFRPSLNELAEILAERAGKQFTPGFKEQMKVLINIRRQRLLVDSLNSRPQDREFFKIWIDIPLEPASISNFPGMPKECNLKRTACCLPTPVRANSTMYDFIGYLNKVTPIPVYNSIEIARTIQEGSKYSPIKPYAILINGYIYVFNYTGPGISVAMIPEDMSEVDGCVDICRGEDYGKDCYSDDAPYPITGDIAQRIIQSILADELARDTVNDMGEHKERSYE